MPEHLDEYTIIEAIGTGASGTVFLATDPDHGRPVVIKQLAAELAADAGFLDRFRHEAAVMSRLVHPNCLQVYDFLEEQKGAYIVSEYVAGASLRKVLEDNGRLRPEQALAVTRGALGGLAFAHELGLVHRDLKPENLIADVTGTSRLADFGQATFTGEATGGSRQTTGSPAYMSPEQVRGDPGDVRSDVYAVGAVLYELLAGRPPFVALSRLAVMKMHLERQPPDLSRVNPRVPARLTAVVNQALAKEPQDRFQSAGEFQAVLEEVARDAYGAGWLEAGSIATLVAAAAPSAGAAGPAEVPAETAPGDEAHAAPAVAAPGDEAQAAPAVAAPGDEAHAAPAVAAPGDDAHAAPAVAAPTLQPAPAAAIPETAPDETAPDVETAPGPAVATPNLQRGPGIGKGIAAAVAGLLVGGAVSLVAPPSSLGLLTAASDRLVPLGAALAAGLLVALLGLLLLRRGGPRP